MCGVEASARVCPFCGEPPGAGVFCDACGRNLAAVERLPTRAEWQPAGAEAGGIGAAPLDAASPAGPHDPGAPVDAPAGSVEERCAAAAAAFLGAMDAAGRPATTTWPTPKPSAFRRAGKVEGWVVRPVDREDFERPKRYEPGLVLSVEGRFHRLDSELRGWGQRDFPHYHHTVSAEPVEPAADDALVADLAALRAAHEGGAPGRTATR
jgi:hypothetical protein